MFSLSKQDSIHVHKEIKTAIGKTYIFVVEILNKYLPMNFKSTSGNSDSFSLKQTFRIVLNSFGL